MKLDENNFIDSSEAKEARNTLDKNVPHKNKEMLINQSNIDLEDHKIIEDKDLSSSGSIEHAKVASEEQTNCEHAENNALVILVTNLVNNNYVKCLLA